MIKDANKVINDYLGEIVLNRGYYAFSQHANSSFVFNQNRYFYNGKKLQEGLQGEHVRLVAPIFKKDSILMRLGFMTKMSDVLIVILLEFLIEWTGQETQTLREES